MFSHSFNIKRHQPQKMVLLRVSEYPLFSISQVFFSWFCAFADQMLNSNVNHGCIQASDMLQSNDIRGQCEVPLN